MSLLVTVNSDYSIPMDRLSRIHGCAEQGITSRQKAIALVAILALTGAAYFYLKSFNNIEPYRPRPCDQKVCDVDRLSLLNEGGCYCLTSKAHDDWIKKKIGQINLRNWCPIGSGPVDLQFANKCPA